jgi:hypothetical protein
VLGKTAFGCVEEEAASGWNGKPPCEGIKGRSRDSNIVIFVTTMIRILRDFHFWPPSMISHHPRIVFEIPTEAEQLLTLTFLDPRSE